MCTRTHTHRNTYNKIIQTIATSSHKMLTAASHTSILLIWSRLDASSQKAWSLCLALYENMLFSQSKQLPYCTKGIIYVKRILEFILWFQADTFWYISPPTLLFSEICAPLTRPGPLSCAYSSWPHTPDLSHWTSNRRDSAKLDWESLGSVWKAA